ncbi:MAG: NAD(P)H-hydrate dehydratase [Nitrospirae bacterium]|nr:NAD(P)H-hydrate dehydratase [Nitrospirota bacterium]
MKVVSAQEMAWLDRETSAKQDISSLILMENAGQKSYTRIASLFGPLNALSILIVAGEGNNGGDGLVLARALLQRDLSPVLVLPLGSPKKSESKVNYDIYKKMGGNIFQGKMGLDELPALILKSDIIVDALFGTGLSRPVSGKLSEMIRQINQSGKIIVSLDIPSGISADTGEVLGSAVNARVTLTYGLPKKGHFLFPGAAYRGKLFVEDIGIPPALVHQAGIKTTLLDALQIKEILPKKRTTDSHKGTYGHLLVLAGSRVKRGAGALCCKAALRTGAGLVTWGLPESLDSPDPFIPEVMTLPLPQTPEGNLGLAGADTILDAVRRKTAVAIGPGLGTHRETRALLKKILPKIEIPVILDADGINLIAEEKGLLKSLKNPILLTPHPGEFARLVGMEPEAIQKNRFSMVSVAARENRSVFVLKGAYTLISAPDESVWINPTGNPGMATAGTGDVLTGIIGALAAQGLSLVQAAQAGVYLHGMAGDLAREEKGEVGMIASDLIEKIPVVIKTFRSEEDE